MAAAANQLVQQRFRGFPDFVEGKTYFIKETFLNEQGQPHETEYKYEAKLVKYFSRDFNYQKNYMLTFSVESIQNVGEVRIPSHPGNHVHINFQDGFGDGKDPNIIRLKNIDEYINAKTIFPPIINKTKKDIQKYMNYYYSSKVSTDDGKLIGIRKHPYFEDKEHTLKEEIPYPEYPYHVVTISERVVERAMATQVLRQKTGKMLNSAEKAATNYLRGGKKRRKTKNTKKGRKHTRRCQTRKPNKRRTRSNKRRTRKN